MKQFMSAWRNAKTLTAVKSSKDKQRPVKPLVLEKLSRRFVMQVQILPRSPFNTMKPSLIIGACAVGMVACGMVACGQVTLHVKTNSIICFALDTNCIYTPDVSIQYEDGWSLRNPTNVLASYSYTGTFQVGTTFYRVVQETNIVYTHTVVFDIHNTYSDTETHKTNITAKLEEIK